MDLDVVFLIPLRGLVGRLGVVLRAYLARWEGSLRFGLPLRNAPAAGLVDCLPTGSDLPQGHLFIAVMGYGRRVLNLCWDYKNSLGFWHTGRSLKNALNSVRQSAYPPHGAIVGACAALGLVVFDPSFPKF